MATCNCVQTVPRPPRDDDLRALGVKRRRQPRTDARSAACDENRFHSTATVDMAAKLMMCGALAMVIFSG